MEVIDGCEEDGIVLVDFVEIFEFLCDFGNGSCDDGL